jgi:hypothetical protein
MEIVEFNDYKEHDSKLIPGSFNSLKNYFKSNNNLICYNLKDFTKGWIIGDFEPTIFGTKDFEISIKYYNKNDFENEHYHKIAKEWTCVLNGKVQFNNQIFEKDSIILVNPYQKIKFKALENSTTVVIKIPSVKGDKYII